jgi:hypothetical protein
MVEVRVRMSVHMHVYIYVYICIYIYILRYIVLKPLMHKNYRYTHKYIN